MAINAKEFLKVSVGGELAEYMQALTLGKPVLEHDPVEGWSQVKRINPALSADDYFVGEIGPKR